MAQLKSFKSGLRQLPCHCHTWAWEGGTVRAEGHHPECVLVGLGARFPRQPWDEADATPNALHIRMLLAAGYRDMQTAQLTPLMDQVLGWERCPVRIPFTTRKGVTVTLLGGRIHAGDGMTWDVLGEPSWDGYEEHMMLTSAELVRLLRHL